MTDESAAERKRRHRDAVRKKKAKLRFEVRVIKKAVRLQRQEEALRHKLATARAKGTKKRGPPKGLPRPERWVAIPTRAGRRLVLPQPQLVFSAGAFANKIGRTSATIRYWVDTGVLPGPSIRLGGRAYFTERYISAILKATERLYAESGVGSLDTLRRLARQELHAAGESWIPQGGSEDDRKFADPKGGTRGDDLRVPVSEGS
jgi:hypothetical protein